jgi:quinol monooxygenase YgiN
MSQAAVRVVAHIHAKAGKEKELQTILMTLLEPTRKEKGCREYRLYQNNQDSADFTFVEEWDSDAVLEVHLKTPHVQAALSQVPALVDTPPDVRRYRLVG